MGIRNATLAGVLSLATLIGAVAVADDWVDLFNGKDLEGWEQKGGAALYRVEDGVLVGQSVPDTPNSFLCTTKSYGDFVLEFEFMGHPELNSGAQIRSESRPDYLDGRVHGYQVELEQETRDRYWSGGIYDEGRRGWIYPSKDEANEAQRVAFGAQGKSNWKMGDWNHVKVKAKGDSIKTWVNGELRADLKDNMTAGGFIALQVHGVGGNKEPMTVKWRNIRLKELPE
tara:strand:- start:1880 stop:2563 length:684 start_codon:yes stop_codon:yes gene_type:complete